MFEIKGKRCASCMYKDVDVNARNQADRLPCIDCSRLYKDYYMASERELPDDQFECIKCHKIIDVTTGLRSSSNPKEGICKACFNKT